MRLHMAMQCEKVLYVGVASTVPGLVATTKAAVPFVAGSPLCSTESVNTSFASSRQQRTLSQSQLQNKALSHSHESSFSHDVV